jgi:hypothetical protein
MHFYSYDLKDPIFECDAWHLSFQIITLENIYGLDPKATTITEVDNGWSLKCNCLSWAGQQQHAEGAFSASIIREDDKRIRVSMNVQAPQKIRVVKMLVRDLSELIALDALDAPREIPHEGIIDSYPNPLRIPLLYTKTSDGQLYGFRAEDKHQRPKRFATYQERMGPLAGHYTVECIHEDDARWFDTSTEVPNWILERDVNVTKFRDEYLAFAESQCGLIPYEAREDIPDWARDIRLCLTLHGMHWSGYTFNTYKQMQEIIAFVTERIAGKHILVYLPGWEGRYYWQYGDFRPDPLLGGHEDFASLCDFAAERGVHVMPMFGGNCANSWSPNFHSFGPSSHMKTATRNQFNGNQPDWDMSRTHDTGWQAWLNPGAPAWQNELVNQINNLIKTYNFDGVFLDTVEVWTNDPDFNIREGYRAIVDKLRGERPNLLVTAEDWYDGLLPIFPIFQQSGNWRQVPDWVGRYARLIGHICDSEPGRGSTGVFEWGYTPYKRLPQGAPYIATIAFTDGTLETAKDEIIAIIEQIQ